MLGCNETLGVDDGNSEGIELGASLGDSETGADGTLSTQSVPFQQNPLPQSQIGTKSLSDIVQSQSTLLQVFGNCGVPSQHCVSVTIPPFSAQKLIAGDSVGLGVAGTGAGVGSCTGEGVGAAVGSVLGIGVGFKPGPSLQQPSLQSQKSVTVYVASTTC